MGLQIWSPPPPAFYKWDVYNHISLSLSLHMDIGNVEEKRGLKPAGGKTETCLSSRMNSQYSISQAESTRVGTQHRVKLGNEKGNRTLTYLYLCHTKCMLTLKVQMQSLILQQKTNTVPSWERRWGKGKFRGIPCLSWKRPEKPRSSWPGKCWHCLSLAESPGLCMASWAGWSKNNWAGDRMESHAQGITM